MLKTARLQRHWLLRTGSRRLLLAGVLGGMMLIGPARPAHATGVNVVSNPGFEQGGCGGGSPAVCGWTTTTSDGSISQNESNPHSGSASMHIECGAGCDYDPGNAWASMAVPTTVCVAIGPGTHPASFWHRDVVGTQVSLDVGFYSGNDCTSYNGQDSLLEGSPTGPGWQQTTGALVAPGGTRSASFVLNVAGWCDAFCSLSANFDDIDVDDASVTGPIVSSFSPSSGWAHTELRINGYNFLGATALTFNGTPAQFFSVESDRSIDAYVPSGATPGPISVTTASGTGWSSSSFTLVPPPTISSFTPTGGVFGTVIDIHGSNFTGAVWVQFNSSYARDFTVDSDSEIHATVPDGATTGPISITTVSGTGSSSSPFAVPTPTISSFAPMSGEVGTSVDIHGTNFARATIVTFNSKQADFTVDSDSEIHAIVPSGATTGWISVATPGGSVLSTSSFVVGTDATPPETTITSGPSGTSKSTSATVTFTASEPSTFQCSLDSGAYEDCTSPRTYTALGQGSHAFRVRATDAAGNTDPTPAARTWTVETNVPPTAVFTFNCAALTCSFDGATSSDSDGSIHSYAWNFGDGTSGSGATTTHSYMLPADHVVTLTVTDNGGSTAASSKTITLIGLRATGYKQRGLEKVDLSWSGASGASFDVYRNDSKIATVQAGAYTDNPNTKGSGTYAYKVCAASICSNTASVTF